MRRILLLAGLGVVGLLIWQNWSVSFPIVFLLWRTPAYPLGLLILAGLCLGALLGIVLLVIWSLGHQTLVKTSEPPRRERTRPKPPPEPEPEIDDWFTEPTTSPARESWTEARNVTPPEEQLPNPETEQVPADRPPPPGPEVHSSRSSPPPQNSKPRRPRPKPRADVVDAEFRVLTPPYTPPQPTPVANPDPDWGDWLEEETGNPGRTDRP